eukprot:scaffold382_cov415-Chaetoceros_neogracile.AAC.18
MGRVTVFSIDGCPHCLRAKQNLKDRNIPYVEINLSSHPDKRSDMLSLADSLTVPQIFFNNDHIGGAVELIKLLEDWDADGPPSATDKVHAGYLSGEDPTDSRLEPSTTPPVKESPPQPRNQDDNIILPKNLTGTVLEMTQRLIQVIPRYNLLHLGKTYKNATKGKTFTDALVTEFSIDREKAVAFGKYLQQRKIVDHVTGGHVFQDTKDLYYRLQPFQSPGTMNSYRIWTDRIDPDYMGVISRLSKVMQGIHHRCTNKKSDVDLAAAEQDEQYAKFEEGICELQGISIDKMDVNSKTAFLINVYNLLIKYAFIKYGFPDSNLKRASFFTSIHVNIGGDNFSFSDLENGILRANAFPPYAFKKQFASSDPRAKLVLGKVDNRIHFALNCGAVSCPPVKKFSVKDLEEELRIVALSFCEQKLNITVSPEKNSVKLSTIFKWYKNDFAQTTNGLPKALLKYTSGDTKEALQKMLNGDNEIKVKFNEYDWSSNITNSKTFDASSLKSDQYVLKTIFGQDQASN